MILGESPATAKLDGGVCQKAPRFNFNKPLPWYQVLGVSKNAEWDAIKARYRQLAQEFHPDLSQDEQATQKMQLINWAFDQAKALKTQS